MRWLPLVALSSGCFEYGLAPVNDTVDPAAGPSISTSAEAPVGPQDEPFSAQGLPLAFDDEPFNLNGVPVNRNGVTLTPNGAPVGSDDGPDMGLDPVESIDLKPGGPDGGDLAPAESSEPTTDWWNDPWSDPPDGTLPEDDHETSDPEGPPHGGLARMTGGGQVEDAYGTIGHSFTVHCQWTHDTNQLNIDLGDDGRFDLEDVDWVVCLDDPALDAQQPEPDFDTVVGVGWGTLDGQDASVWFVLTDNGEPCDSDWMRFEVTTATDVFAGEGFLVHGNHQVHDPVGQQ